MFAVIFEVEPKAERFDDYLKIAGSLRPALEKIDGFILNERFASAHRPRRLLSLSIWRDEKALIRWRTLGQHHEAQLAGRTEIFAGYRLRVAEILADSQIPAGELVEQRFDETEIGEAKAVTLSEAALNGETPAAGLAAALGLPERARGLVDHEGFTSITDPTKLLLLAGWRDRGAAAAWRPASPEAGRLRHRLVRIVRDYGLFDRREAPQYYPPAPPPPA
ncbi:MAG TPA: antibiotic biosynthesis monooxygenase [Stellaceae bacterium]|nr:antibiotic biosynthesis monooxygenase [Stellaceae bacterium]